MKLHRFPNQRTKTAKVPRTGAAPVFAAYGALIDSVLPLLIFSPGID
jgi:hypothetical protein